MTSSGPNINLDNLRKAGRGPVIDALIGFSGKPVDKWLQGHPASKGQFLNGKGKALTDYSAFKHRFSDEQIAEVLAATAPNHCMDGWTYLSRALAALLAGDTHTARHLAYYAQLRAGLSILGCNGIGIFNTINFAIDESCKVHRLDAAVEKRKKQKKQKRGLGTHTAAWEVLRNWASDSQSAEMFLQSIRFRGVSLLDCIGAIWPSSGAPLTMKVVEEWGFDLRQVADEHESRNISSYCAHAFNPAASRLDTRLKLILDIWSCLDPDGQGGFPLLDRCLLRKFLELMKREQSRIASPGDFWDANRFSKLHPSIQEFVSLEFLKRDEGFCDDPIVFTYASDKSSGNVHAMICRALLLLRTASSIVRSAFMDAGFEPLEDNVRPWFEPVGIDRGFWSDGQQPAEIADLWDEVRNAVSDVSDVYDSISSEPPTDQREFLDSFSTQAAFLSQTERACMWAVGA